MLRTAGSIRRPLGLGCTISHSVMNWINLSLDVISQSVLFRSMERQIPAPFDIILGQGKNSTVIMAKDKFYPVRAENGVKSGEIGLMVMV